MNYILTFIVFTLFMLPSPIPHHYASVAINITADHMVNFDRLIVLLWNIDTENIDTGNIDTGYTKFKN